MVQVYFALHATEEDFKATAYLLRVAHYLSHPQSADKAEGIRKDKQVLSGRRFRANSEHHQEILRMSVIFI